MSTPLYTILITGGSSGIGTDLCRHYLDAGYRVISLARQQLDWTHEHLVQQQVDLLDEAATAAVVQELAQKYEITHFIHNAGVIWPNLLPDVQLKELQGLTQIHLGAAIQIMQALLPTMKARGFGRVVLISSRGALGLETRTAYSATKAGMIGMARTWALELADTGITVDVIAPGPIQTDMFYEVIEAGSEREQADRKSTRLNSSHVANSYAVFCLKKKKKKKRLKSAKTEQSEYKPDCPASAHYQ